MQEHLETQCNVEDWTTLRDSEKLLLELKAQQTPSFFWGHKALGNHPLWPVQQEILDDFYKTENGKRNYNELLLEGGRQGGKTFTAAIIICTELYRLLMLPDPHSHYNISKARAITLFMSSAGLKQTLSTIFPTVKALIEISPYLSQYIENTKYSTSGVIKFPKNIHIEAVGSNIKTAVGRTVKAYVAEEVNSVGTDTGMVTPGVLYRKLSKSTTMFAPVGEDVRVAISSKTGGYDFLTQAIENALDKKMTRTMIVRKDTVQMNPFATEQALSEEKDRDEDAYNEEYKGIASTAGRFFKPVVIDRVNFTVPNLFTVPELGKQGSFVPDFLGEFDYDVNSYSYILGLDPSSINDPFGISVLHYTNDDKIIVDGYTAFRPGYKEEINPTLVRQFVTKILSDIPINYCVYDIALYNETRSMVEEKGITMSKHIVNIEDWNQLKNQISAGLVYMPDSPYIKNEIRELQVKGSKVDHPYGGTKDILDTICNASTLMFRDDKPQPQSVKYFGSSTFIRN